MPTVTSLAILRSTHPLLICVLLFDRIYTYIFIIHSHNHNLHTLLESIVFDLGGSGGTVARWHGGEENFPKIILSTTTSDQKSPLSQSSIDFSLHLLYREGQSCATRVKVAQDGNKVARKRGPIFDHFSANEQVAPILFYLHLGVTHTVAVRISYKTSLLYDKTSLLTVG
jgi:hypothetical protein